jgi:hypothetical protein
VIAGPDRRWPKGHLPAGDQTHQEAEAVRGRCRKPR